MAAGPDLEILALEKSGCFGSVRVTYQALPSQSPVFVHFCDKASGRSGKVEALRMKSFDDVKALVGSVEITADAITLKPRNTPTAKMTTREYKTPVRVPIARILGR